MTRPTSVLDEDPAVLTWRILLAEPRPAPTGRHWWRDLVWQAWHAADHAWWLEREAYAVGNKTEMAEFQQLKPRPMLRDFMVHLSAGHRDLYELPRSAGGLFAD